MDIILPSASVMRNSLPQKKKSHDLFTIMLFQTIELLMEHKGIAEESSHSSFHTTTVHGDHICQAQKSTEIKANETSLYESCATFQVI